MSQYLIDINYDKDKLLGMVYGVAIGDALGAPFEFTRVSPKLKYNGILQDESVYVQFQYHKLEIKPWSFTDDTEMMIVLLKSIFENKGYDRNDTILRYLKWAQKSGFMGKNTRELMKGVKTVKGYEKRKAKQTVSSQSNGSLMRASPLALLKNWKENTIIDTSLTNDNDVNRESSLIYVSLLRTLLYGYNFECEIKEKSVKKVLESAVKGKILDISGKSKGWVLHGLYATFITYFNNSSYEGSMDYIMENFVGNIDTDTIMAIVGGVMGASIGFKKMSQEPKTKINIKKINKSFENSVEYNLLDIIEDNVSEGGNIIEDNVSEGNIINKFI